MSKKRKKEIRRDFRDAVFERDDYVCLMCGLDADKEWYHNRKTCDEVLDAHHITKNIDAHTYIYGL